MKKFLALFLVLLLIVSMGACGKKEEQTNNESQPEVSEPDKEITVEKGDWIPASISGIAFEVRENWVNEKRDTIELEYYYFDDSKENYIIVSYETGYRDILKNTVEDFELFLGGQLENEADLDFKVIGAETVGENIGGYKFVYNDKQPNN